MINIDKQYAPLQKEMHSVGQVPMRPSGAIVPVEPSRPVDQVPIGRFRSLEPRAVAISFGLSVSSENGRLELQMGGIDKNGWYSKNGALVQRSKDSSEATFATEQLSCMAPYKPQEGGPDQLPFSQAFSKT